jgi:hypothetical protein
MVAGWAADSSVWTEVNTTIFLTNTLTSHLSAKLISVHHTRYITKPAAY